MANSALAAKISSAVVFIGMLLFTLVGTGPLAAEEAASVGKTAAVTVEAKPGITELESLAATLEEPEARAALLRQIRALIAVQRGPATEHDTESPGSQFLANLSEQINRTSEEVVSAAEAALDLPRLATWIQNQARDPERRARWFEVLFKIVLALAVGGLAEWLVRWLLRKPRRSVEGRETDSLLIRLPFLMARTALDLLPIAAFAAAAYGALSLVDPRETTRIATITLVNANVLARGTLAIARMLLTPAVASLRILPLTDRTANYLFLWLRRFANTAVYGYFVIEALLLLGVPAAAHGVLMKLLGLMLTVLGIVVILQNRLGVAHWMRGEGVKTGLAGNIGILRARFADIWHVLAILYVVGIYAVAALRIEGGFRYVFQASVVSVVILLAAKLLSVGLRRIVDRGFALSDDLKLRFPTLEAQANRYLPVLQSVLRTVIYGFALLGLLQAWGLNAFGWLTSDFGRQVIGGFVKIAVVGSTALLGWTLLSAAVERYLSRTDAEGNAIQRSARARTLLPLARRTVMIVLWTLVGLVALSEIGIDIGPLLAGAGIVGLAVGFGAQTLVKDIITGIFILMEDTIAVGDVVEVAGHGGVVEAISIRTIRLRDVGGTVRVVPFSEVGAVMNRTKDFSYYLLDVGVAYREDTDEVVKVLREICDELREDETYGPNIIDPLDVQGVDRFEDSAVIIRARIKTLPIKQWMVGREFNRRMKKRFDALGIEIPFPHQTIYFGEDKAGRAPPAHVRVVDEPAEGMARKEGKTAPSSAGEGDQGRVGLENDDAGAEGAP